MRTERMLFNSWIASAANSQGSSLLAGSFGFTIRPNRETR
jgi:hypothetical protein